MDEGLFSDHIMFSLDLVRPGSNTRETFEMVPDWSKADFSKIADNLAAIDWVTELEGKGALSSWDYVKEVIDNETERCVPKKRRRTGHRPLWMTQNVLRLISFQESTGSGEESS